MANFIVTTFDDTVADDGVLSLREALTLANAASDVDTITFDAALSDQTITLGGTELVLSTDVTIDGDIDGDNSADITISGGDVSRVFIVSAGTSTLHALTITGGYVDGKGGGLYIGSSATVHLSNSVLHYNRAYDGGGIFSLGTVTLTNSTLSGNIGDYGGGIFNAGTATLINSTLSGNVAAPYSLNRYGREGAGGGLLNEGTATLTNSTISTNYGKYGGGIYNAGTVTLTNSTLSENRATYGGGIENTGTVTLTNSTLSGNEATLYGGGGMINRGTATLTNSTLSMNYAYGPGGGILNIGTATLTNSTLSENRASYGGGIFNAGTVTLTNSTLSENTAIIYYFSGLYFDPDLFTRVGDGGGIFNNPIGTATLINSTLSGNYARSGGGIHNYGTATLSNSIVLGNTAATNANVGGAVTVTATTSLTSGTAADVFAALNAYGGGLLADNGGPVLTIALNTSVTNPALDAGDDSIAPALDASGAPRFDDPAVSNNGGNISDLGALEVLVEAPSLIVTTASDVVDVYDFETSLREALALANSDADLSTITFDASLSGQTIVLGGTQLSISSDVIIDGDINGDDAADITISGNDASRVLSVSSDATLQSLTLINGNAGSDDGGGLMIFGGGDVHLINSTISGNEAYNGGGIRNLGTVTLTNSTVSGNDAVYSGGGIFNTGTATLTNATLSGNTAGLSGGGLFNFGSATLLNTTISGNDANANGGGFFHSSGGGGLILENSIVLGNTATTSPNANDGTFINSTSLTGLGGETAADVFASLSGAGGLLADNGGPVQTIALNPDLLNPALDAGNDSAAPTTDARGAGRADAVVANNGANISDLGAVEAQSDAPSLIVTTASDVVDATDGVTSLREAVAFANSNADTSTITFDLGAGAHLLTLGGSELVLSTSIVIDGDTDGDGDADITISGDDASRVFHAAGGTSTLNALNITDGHSSGGGGLYVTSGASVNIVDSTLSDNFGSYGGAIANSGTVSLTNSTLHDNSAIAGGGIHNLGSATLVSSTLSGNTAVDDGGGIRAGDYATTTLTNST
ncbi:beta strand repeat-containing protein, partial [Phaeobacter marinintestinus]|uniref:beta strand repeat-containing protein n=1 Tax=Falsiphaeobacter marinintestinus TaxID=1492905 RepID=UPI001C96FCD9